jgi:trehalose 6-phosphate phosphatase
VLDVDATIAALTAQPERTALLVDFDGSLSAIVERAEDARPLPEAVAQLSRLASQLGRVAVVSGRPAEFLATHLPVTGVDFVGLYGMETLIDGAHAIDERALPFLDEVKGATDAAERVLPADLIERKSGVCVVLHWRPAPDREAQVRALATDLAAQFGLTQLVGRKAIELRPPVAIDKGDATRALIEGFAVGAFAGDDTGDLPAFAALADAATDGTLDVAVRIGVHSPEAPPELEGAVDVLVDGPFGLVALLARVADEIGEPHGGRPR